MFLTFIMVACILLLKTQYDIKFTHNVHLQ